MEHPVLPEVLEAARCYTLTSSFLPLTFHLPDPSSPVWALKLFSLCPRRCHHAKLPSLFASVSSLFQGNPPTSSVSGASGPPWAGTGAVEANTPPSSAHRRPTPPPPQRQVQPPPTLTDPKETQQSPAQPQKVPRRRPSMDAGVVGVSQRQLMQQQQSAMAKQPHEEQQSQLFAYAVEYFIRGVMKQLGLVRVISTWKARADVHSPRPAPSSHP
jgi:hypothetical protein